MYRRSLRPRWREITASVLVIAVLGSSAGILAGKRSAPGQEYYSQPQGEDLDGLDLVGHRKFSCIQDSDPHMFL